jgi:hypothetical protein
MIPLLKQMHPVHTFPPYFFKLHSNIILPSTSRSSEWSLFPSTTYHHICSSVCSPHTGAHTFAVKVYQGSELLTTYEGRNASRKNSTRQHPSAPHSITLIIWNDSAAWLTIQSRVTQLVKKSPPPPIIHGTRKYITVFPKANQSPRSCLTFRKRL